MKKYLGQHFLVNKNAVTQIIEALELKERETVIEIGPGRGALTFDLARIGAKVIAIEKDEELANWLINEVANWKNVEITKGDALKILPQLIDSESQSIECRVVGNIPYYITGKLLRVLSELKKKPGIVVLTIQREVAERIVAKPPKMNLLAAITQFWAETEIISYLKPEDFNPVPEVHSAIIKLKPKIMTYDVVNFKPEDYFEFVKILFKQPRKTILNNLRDGLGSPKEEIFKILEKNEIKENERAQNLGVERIVDLAVNFIFR